MPLFRDRPARSIAVVAIALSLGYFITNLMTSLYAFHMSQTSVAILAISSLIFLVTMHHRRDGRLLTQTQEEMALIGGIALLWIAILLAWRGFSYRDVHSGGIRARNVSPGRRSMAGMRGDTEYGQALPYPCSEDDIYCVEIEEEYYF